MTGEPDGRDDGAPTTPRAGGGRHRAQRSRTRAVLLALLAVLVVAAGLAVGLGTLQVDTVAEDVGRVDDPFPDEQDRPEVPETAQEALTFLAWWASTRRTSPPGPPGPRRPCWCG